MSNRHANLKSWDCLQQVTCGVESFCDKGFSDYSYLKALSFKCRPEIKFSGLQALIRRINMDKGIAVSQLDLAMHSKHAERLSQKTQ